MSCNKANNCEKYKINIGNPYDWENPCNSCPYNISDYDIGYNKAIDDFLERLKAKYGCLGYIDEISFENIDKIAEEMKKGGGNSDN